MTHGSEKLRAIPTAQASPSRIPSKIGLNSSIRISDIISVLHRHTRRERWAAAVSDSFPKESKPIQPFPTSPERGVQWLYRIVFPRNPIQPVLEFTRRKGCSGALPKEQTPSDDPNQPVPKTMREISVLRGCLVWSR